MDLPDDKRQVVMDSSNEKKWQVVRDNTRRRRQVPPCEYLSKLRFVMDADGPKKSKRRAQDPATIRALQALEISLRTNHIRYVHMYVFIRVCMWGKACYFNIRVLLN
jgi:hypothetical protein